MRGPSTKAFYVSRRVEATLPSLAVCAPVLLCSCAPVLLLVLLCSCAVCFWLALRFQALQRALMIMPPLPLLLSPPGHFRLF